MKKKFYNVLLHAWRLEKLRNLQKISTKKPLSPSIHWEMLLEDQLEEVLLKIILAKIIVLMIFN